MTPLPVGLKGLRRRLRHRARLEGRGFPTEGPPALAWFVPSATSTIASPFA